MDLKSVIVLQCLLSLLLCTFFFFFFKLIWSSNTASQDSQINIYHLPQLWDCLRQRSLCLLPIRSCFWHRDGDRKKRWEKEREWEILAEVPERLQIPLPQLWDLNNSCPQDTLCQMAQLAGLHTREHGGSLECQFPHRRGHATDHYKAWNMNIPSSLICIALCSLISVLKKHNAHQNWCLSLSSDLLFFIWSGRAGLVGQIPQCNMIWRLFFMPVF